MDKTLKPVDYADTDQPTDERRASIIPPIDRPYLRPADNVTRVECQDRGRYFLSWVRDTLIRSCSFNGLYL